MANTQNIDVATLLGSIASMVSQDEAKIDQIDAREGKGTHGTRVAQAFKMAARAAQEADTQDAGAQFAAAAQAMREKGKGRAIGYYANGLEQAAAQFSGKQSISANDLGSLLDALAGGVQQGNPAQPGQGTMLDAILPAARTYMDAQQGGVSNSQAALDALKSAASGAFGTIQTGGGSGYGAGAGNVDPGAASATSVLGGIFKALLPTLASLAMQQLSKSGASAQPQAGIPQGGYAQSPGADPFGGLGRLVGGLLGGSGAAQPSQPGAYGQSQGGDPFGGLGGLLGGLLGGTDTIQPGAQDGTSLHREHGTGDTVA